MILTYYKIRSKRNPEMFRKADGSWNKSGKVYDTLGKLRTVITLKLNNRYVTNELQDWEIVEFEVSVKDVKQLHEIVKPERVMDLLKK